MMVKEGRSAHIQSLICERSTMNDNDTSDGTSSASESSVDVPVAPTSSKSTVNTPSKKRKSTYYVRKDEIHLLQEQIQHLQAKLAEVEHSVPSFKTAVGDALLTNASLTSALEQNNLMVAGTQSLLTAYNLSTFQPNGHVPLKDYIHLPVDLDQRNAILTSMYESKLLVASNFMQERTRYLDLRVAHHQLEQFQLPQGDVGVIATDITLFEGGHSLRQVYDALMFFVMNQEISFSEKLGILTIRESEDIDEFKVCQTRFLSSIPGDVEIESNVVMFATCVETSDTVPGFMIGTIDFVDQDDLYPYRPDFCFRKELTAAVTMHEIPSLTGDPPSIAMARWSYSRIPAPAFAISDEVKAAGLASLVQFCDIIPKIMKERLLTIVPQSD